jgi:hypothetical protein
MLAAVFGVNSDLFLPRKVRFRGINVVQRKKSGNNAGNN